MASFPCCKQAALPVCQTSHSLPCLWAWSPAAEHMLQSPSEQGPKRKTEEQRSAASMADWQLESVSQTSCLYCVSSTVSGLRMCAHCALSCCSLPGSTSAELWAWPSEPVASSPFSGCHFHALQALLSLFKNTQALAAERRKSFMGLSVGGNELRCVGEHLQRDGTWPHTCVPHTHTCT